MRRIICVLILMLLSGCSFPEEIGKDTVLREVRLVTESPIFNEEKETVWEEDEESGEWEEEPQDILETATEFVEQKEQTPPQDEIGEQNTETSDDAVSDGPRKSVENFTDEVKAELMRKQQGLYAYSNLEITQQNLYVEILYALENYVDEMEVSTKDTSEIDKVFQCVLIDHPEIFYADGYSFVKYTLGEQIQKITFKGTYVYEWEEKEELQAKIKTAAMEMLKKLPASATDYEKVKYVYETIIHQTEYSLEASDNQNICSVFLGHASVCQGYAKAVQFLLQMLKVPVTLVIGTVETGEGHAWNMVQINHQYYYVDATWGDASYRDHSKEEEEIHSSTPSINYDYLCVTTADIMQTHSMGNLIPLPVCDSMEANYYVREGAYFTAADYDGIRQLIERYRNENRESVTIKCANDEVYEELVKGLLQEQKIFHYLESDNNSIVYTDSQKQRSLTFWL